MSIKDETLLPQGTQIFFILETRYCLWLFNCIYQNFSVGRDFSPPLLSLMDIGGLKPRPTDINVFRFKFVVIDRKAENGF